MEFQKFGALHYVTIAGVKYQIGPEEGGGLMVRLVEAEGVLSGSRLSVTASASNTFHLRPDPL